MGKTIKKQPKRDKNIEMSYAGEINLNTRSIKSKKQYSRKKKYPDQY